MSEHNEIGVLLVEDEPSIRGFAAIVLERQGFSVVSACSANEAIALSSKTSEHIDLLVTDVQLGDGDGISVAEEIRKKRRNIGVVVMSGIPANAQRARQNGYTFLPKPFRPAKLVEAVRRLLPR